MKTFKQQIEDLLSEFGCSGKCVHDNCYSEKECEECYMDYDDWCLTYRIYEVINDNNK